MAIEDLHSQAADYFNEAAINLKKLENAMKSDGASEATLGALASLRLDMRGLKRTFRGISDDGNVDFDSPEVVDVYLVDPKSVYRPGDEIHVAVEFDEPIKDVGFNSRLELSIGDATYEMDQTGPFGDNPNRLEFYYYVEQQGILDSEGNVFEIPHGPLSIGNMINYSNVIDSDGNSVDIYFDPPVIDAVVDSRVLINVAYVASQHVSGVIEPGDTFGIRVGFDSSVDFQNSVSDGSHYLDFTINGEPRRFYSVAPGGATSSIEFYYTATDNDSGDDIQVVPMVKGPAIDGVSFDFSNNAKFVLDNQLANFSFISEVEAPIVNRIVITKLPTLDSDLLARALRFNLEFSKDVEAISFASISVMIGSTPFEFLGPLDGSSKSTFSWTGFVPSEVGGELSFVQIGEPGFVGSKGLMVNSSLEGVPVIADGETFPLVVPSEEDS